MAFITDNEIFGENYYTAGRYNYTAIDKTHANGTGTSDCMTGIKPRKLADRICSELITCQHKSMEGLIAAIHFGESGNSEAIYLYATNDSETYHQWLRGTLVNLKRYLDTPERDRKAYDIQSIIRSLDCAFTQAIEKYKKEFAEESKFKNYTQLDIFTCINQWLEHYKGEYSVNKLSGYESEK